MREERVLPNEPRDGILQPTSTWTYSRSKQRPITKQDRELRKVRARKVEARIAFLDEPYRGILDAACGACGQLLGRWMRSRWESEGAPTWSTDLLLLAPSDAGPGEPEIDYSYSGYPDTGYEVVVVTRHEQPRRTRATGGIISRDGHRIGRRPRPNGSVPMKIARMLTEGQIVTLPAHVYCPICKNTLNTVPAPSRNESAL